MRQRCDRRRDKQRRQHNAAMLTMLGGDKIKSIDTSVIKDALLGDVEAGKTLASRLGPLPLMAIAEPGESFTEALQREHRVVPSPHMGHPHLVVIPVKPARKRYVACRT